MSTAERPEPDRVAGALHPRGTLRLLGQAAAEGEFLAAFDRGRLHHGWLITGQRGTGKATLAWRIARFLLAGPAEGDRGRSGAATLSAGLEVDTGHPVARRMRAGSEPRLFLLRRPWNEDTGRLRAEITVAEARRLNGFFRLSAAEGGRRVVIVDAADELNASAANAILKLLEEPPEGAVLLLVSHQPLRLLPTIRSRCRTLRCRPLDAAALRAALPDDAGRDAEALAELADGSVGVALQIAQAGGVAAYAEITTLFARVPAFDRAAAVRLAEGAAGRGSEARFDLLLALAERFLARLARTGAGRPPLAAAAEGEIAILNRLAPDPPAARRWVDLQQDLMARARRGRAVNLDPAVLILDMVLRIRDTATALVA